MKIRCLAVLPFVVLSIAGSSSAPPKQSQEKAPPKANRVQVLIYDNSPRTPTTNLDICQSAPQRPYKTIALLTCEGRVDQEVVMTTAIFYRARRLGADAVLNAGTITTQGETTINVADTVEKQVLMNAVGMGGSQARCVFRYDALIYSGTNTPLLEQTNNIPERLLGHWLFVPPQRSSIRGQCDMYYLPQNHYKIISDLTNRNGQSISTNSDETGRYYFAGSQLVQWPDTVDKPNDPIDFTVTDKELTLYVKSNEPVIFQKQAP